MARTFTLSGKVTGVTGAETLILLTAGANEPLEVLDVQVSEKTSGGQNLAFKCGHVSNVASAAGTDVSSSIQLHDPEGGSVSATALEKLTTEPTTYTSGDLGRRAVNTEAGYDFSPIPEAFPKVPGGKGFAVRLEDAPAASTDLHYSITCQEL